MGIVNEQQFIRQATTEGIPVSLGTLHHAGLTARIHDIRQRQSVASAARRTLLNEGQARELYAKIREKYTSADWLGKEIRPWTLVPSVIPTVDEPLIGFEFETSPRSSDERLRIKQELWDTFENYSVDPEGGNAGLEVTFSPEPVSAYTSGTSNAQRFAREVLSTMELEKYHADETAIGTHANISIPGIPSTVTERFIYRGLGVMPMCGEDGTNLRLSLFGRALLFGTAYNQVNYVELKTFRTTYDPQVLALYIERVINLINGIKIAAAEHGVSIIDKVCINLYDVMMTGAAPILEDAPNDLPFDGRDGGAWLYNTLSGEADLSDLSTLEVSFVAERWGFFTFDDYNDEDDNDDDYYDDDDDDDY